MHGARQWHPKQQEGSALDLTFEGLPADLAEVGAAFLVTAGHVPQQRTLLGETLLAELAAEGPLTRVGAVVLI